MSIYSSFRTRSPAYSLFRCSASYVYSAAGHSLLAMIGSPFKCPALSDKIIADWPSLPDYPPVLHQLINTFMHFVVDIQRHILYYFDLFQIRRLLNESEVYKYNVIRSTVPYPQSFGVAFQGSPSSWKINGNFSYHGKHGIFLKVKMCPNRLYHTGK